MKHPYSVFIVWSQEDKSFLASVPELPGCIADGSTPTEALKNLNVVVEEWIETAKSLNRKIPKPMDCETHKAAAIKFRTGVQEHIKQEVKKAVENVLSEMQCYPMFAGQSDPAEWWKKQS